MHAVALHHPALVRGLQLCSPRLHRVGLRGDFVLAAAGERPDQGARFGLVERPAGCLLGLVMPPAERYKTNVTYLWRLRQASRYKSVRRSTLALPWAWDLPGWAWPQRIFRASVR